MGAIRAALLLGLAACSAAVALAEPVSIVFNTPENTSQLAVQAMQTEAASILRAEGLVLTWIPRSSLQLGNDVTRPVQVRLRGRCNMTGFEAGRRSEEAYAWTHVSDGAVLPFVEVDCARIRSSLFSVMWGEDFQHRDFLLGRALARVLAHELHHVLDRAHGHSREGLARPKLTAENLIRGQAGLYSGFKAE
jgi:hypothetical protein